MKSLKTRLMELLILSCIIIQQYVHIADGSIGFESWFWQGERGLGGTEEYNQKGKFSEREREGGGAVSSCCH